jgi:hypothetical protein
MMEFIDRLFCQRDAERDDNTNHHGDEHDPEIGVPHIAARQKACNGPQVHHSPACRVNFFRLGDAHQRSSIRYREGIR